MTLDTAGDGTISLAELEALMKCAKRSLMMTNRQIKKLVQKFHQDGNGNIGIDEFLNAIQNVVKEDAI